MSNGVTPGLRSLLGKLTAYKVTHWGGGSENPSQMDRIEGDLNEAHVISSLLKNQPDGAHRFADILNTDKDPWDVDFLAEPLHQIVIDVDHPAHLVESSTPGHFHLYVEIGDGISQSAYFEWLNASVKIGLVEPGYVAACISRGHSDVRLPWISKADTPPSEPIPVASPSRPVPWCVNCHKPCTEIEEYRQMVFSEGGHASADDVTDVEIIDWVYDNEGTISKRTSRFACTDCYIKMGQPTSPRGWTPDDLGGGPLAESF